MVFPGRWHSTWWRTRVALALRSVVEDGALRSILYPIFFVFYSIDIRTLSIAAAERSSAERDHANTIIESNNI